MPRTRRPRGCGTTPCRPTTRPTCPTGWPSSSAPPGRPAPPSARCSRRPPWSPAPAPRTSGSAARASGCSRCRRTTSRGCRCCCARWMPAPPRRDGPHRRLPPTGLHRRRRAARPGPRRYTSLVPTQLLRLLDHPGGPDALRSRSTRCSSVVPRCPPRLRRRAERSRRARGRDLRHERDRGWMRLRRDCRCPAPRSPSTTRAASTSAGATVAARLPRPPRPHRRGLRRRRGRDALVPHRRRRPHRRRAPGCTSTAASTTWSTPAGSRWRPRLVEEAIARRTCPGSPRSSSSAAPTPSGARRCAPSSCSSRGGARRPDRRASCGRTCAASCPTTPCRAGRRDGRRPAPARAGQARPRVPWPPCSAVGMMTACSATSRPCSASR